MNDVVKKFTVIFGANTKPLEHGVKKSESTLKTFAKVFSSLSASYFSYKMFEGVITGFVNLNNKLSDASSLAGYNVQSLSALGGALKRFGGDTDSAIASLNSLNSHLENAKRGGGALVEVAKKYGLTFHDSNGALMDAQTLLTSLSSQMYRFDKQTRVSIGAQLGLHESLIRAYNDGGKELNNLISQQYKFGVATNRDIKISEKFTKAQLDLRDSFQGIIRILARFLLPSLTKLIKLATGFIEFLKKHKQLVVIFFSAMLVAMSPILAMFVKMATASAAAFAPIYAAIATVTAIALIIEDIYYYFKGWNSVTGDLVKKFPLLGKILETIRPIVMGIADTFGKIYDFIIDPSWDKFVEIFKTAGTYIKEYLLAGLEKVKQAISWVTDGLGKVVSWLGFGDSTPPPPALNNNASTNNNVTNNNINVKQNITGSNSQQIANDSAKAINSIVNQRRQMGVR